VIAMTETSRADQWNVLELSSFQLETIRDTFRADIGVCLNVTQNHLDRHRTFENYAAAKGNLFRTQQAGRFRRAERRRRGVPFVREMTPAQVVQPSGSGAAISAI
jgi:UDP-N-acetylmuramoylalanine-D-glutamate ligase